MKKNTQPDNAVAQFMAHPTAGGLLLMLATAFAIVLANSPLHSFYNLLIDIPVVIRLGELIISKHLIVWVNDGLMAFFFLLVGLELKREFIDGELSHRSNITLPALGALGGMLVPATIYAAINYDEPIALHGWAIPAATDIAFVLGVLSLLGPRVPSSLKLFLTSLAIFDDVGAIIIIALFYTSKISLLALSISAFCLVLLFSFNRTGTSRLRPYIIVGVIMWVALLKSGVHATLAGVLLAMFIPYKTHDNPFVSPLKNLERILESTVKFFILPVFAFCNAGINLSGVGIKQLIEPIPLGIAAGLFIGKQVGVFSFCWIGIKLGLARRPKEISWLSLYGASILCGIGFTMSLFIGSLAFAEHGIPRHVDERLGILFGSFISAIVGTIILYFSLGKKKESAKV